MELNVACLHLSVLDINLVSDQNNWNVLANSDDVSVPVRDILVCNSAGHVKHNDGALTLDVITVSQSTELLLSGSIPDIEADLTAVRVELQRVNFDSQCGDILFLELTSSVSLDESCLTNAAISDEEELELWYA